MAAAPYNITIEQGTTVSIPFTYASKVGDTVTPYNVTGWTARMQVRAMQSSNTTLAEFTTENGGITVSGVAGIFTLKITAAQTAAYAFLTGVYDMEVIDQSGNVTRLLKGTFTVDPEVTR